MLGEGGTESRSFELIGASGGREKSMRAGLDLLQKKENILSENAFEAILKPIFPYCITSILSKVRHSNTLVLAMSFAFPCHQV